MNRELKALRGLIIHAPGDGGIDWIGGWSGYTIVDCDKIRPKMVREIEGVLSRYGKFETIGILVASSKENFTKNSKDRVNSSGYNLILTDEMNLESDFINFVESKRIKSTQCNEGQNERSIIIIIASLHHNPEVNDDIMKSIKNYEDGEKLMVRHGKKRKSPSNFSETYKKKAHLNLPRDMKGKERMRHSSSETESDEYESTSLCTKVLSKEPQISGKTTSRTGDEQQVFQIKKYVDLLKEARRGITENFASHDPGKIFKMFSQSINKYFKDSSEASLEPEQFPKIIEDIQGCTKYLAIWNSYFNNCKGLIEIQDYKMLKLVYSLTDVFFIMLKICYQEQVKDTSLAKNTNTWKGRDIKSRMNKFWNIDS
ncbi:17132_t:CDS:2, partial [Cetraspora pellucida]